ncbi:MAG: hypothetical protein ACFBQW_01370 [Sphingomonadaceae bacterium]
MVRSRTWVPALIMLWAFPAAAAEEERARAPLLAELVKCRDIADERTRLACYDRQVAALDAAEARRELVVVDRAEVKKAERSLFGLSLPETRIFTRDRESIDRIETTVAAARQNARGKWSFVLEDGARWHQTDSRELSIEPEKGDPIVIRKAAMGSYLANVKGQIAIRVKRAE